MIVFHTDLDNTLIYSYKHDIGRDKRCVEVYHGQELSFVTQGTHRLLHKLSEWKQQVLIVPTTTRTTEQYLRIDLGVGGFPYALVCNGGVLLAAGTDDDIAAGNAVVREDKKWYRDSLEMIQDSMGELRRAMKLLDQEPRRTFELRFIRDLFVFTKCKDSGTVVGDLKKVLDAEVVDVFSKGAKVYVVPRVLSKGNAVSRFRKYIGAGYVIAAGDGEFDVSMLEAADLGLAPAELVQRCQFPEKVRALPAERHYAEAVLSTVLEVISKNCKEIR